MSDPKTLVTRARTLLLEARAGRKTEAADVRELLSAMADEIERQKARIAELEAMADLYECSCDAYTVTECGAEAHDGAGWYYWDDNYPDEGSVGAFATNKAAEAHARSAYEPECEIHGAIATRLYSQLAARDATIAKLVEALEPFAAAVPSVDGEPSRTGGITWREHYIAARDALASIRGKDGG